MCKVWTLAFGEIHNICNNMDIEEKAERSKSGRSRNVHIFNTCRKPAIGELNGDRSNLRYDFELPTAGQYGECKFEVDFKAKRAKIKEELRGVIARTYLYFNKHYGMKLSKQEMQKYEAWNKTYPPDAWEVERNKRIASVQGNSNPFISLEIVK